MNTKSNLAHEPSKPQGELVQFKRKERQAMSDHFVKGFVMVSRLYLSEVKPFLSPAAKDIYDELNARITGFNKESDHVSYSQLQGGKLKGSKKTSPATVRKGIKELLDLGVISIVSENSRKGNEYKINEVSLAEHFKNKSTTSKIEVLQKLKCEDFNKCSASTSKIEDTIDNFINNSKEIHTHSEPPKNSVDDVLNLWTPDLHSLNSWLQRAGEKALTQDEVNTILLEVNAHYERHIRSDAVSDSKMYSNFVKWVKSDFAKYRKSGNQSSAKPKSALQQTADQWAEERFAEQQKASSIIDVNQDQVLIGGEREYF